MRSLVIGLCLVLAACDRPVPPTVAPSGGKASPVTTASTTPAAASTAVPTLAAPNPAQRMLVVVDAQGIGLRTTDGKLERLAFGAPRAAAEALAARVLGPAKSRISNDECGAGPMEFSVLDPVTLNFQEGALVGWLVDEGAGVATTAGVRTGMSFAEISRKHGAKMIADSTLEGEFELSGANGTVIGGFVKGSGDKARVVSLYSGTNCFFR